VLSVNLQETILTWFLVRRPGKIVKGEVNLKIRQADLNAPHHVTTVTIPEKDRFNFMIFGGFYLTVIRENPNRPKGSSRSIDGKGKPGDAIIILADSRDPDIRAFDKTEYKLVNFREGTVTDYEVPSEKTSLQKAKDIGFGKALLGSKLNITDEIEQFF
jgi:hypothetical protein